MNNSIMTLAFKEIKSKDPYQSIKNILNHAECTHLTKVKFALHCAESSFKHIKDEKTKKIVRKTLDLVANWVISPNSVKNKELNAAANAANLKYLVKLVMLQENREVKLMEALYE